MYHTSEYHINVHKKNENNLTKTQICLDLRGQSVNIDDPLIEILNITILSSFRIAGVRHNTNGCVIKGRFENATFYDSTNRKHVITNCHIIDQMRACYDMVIYDINSTIIVSSRHSHGLYKLLSIL